MLQFRLMVMDGSHAFTFNYDGKRVPPPIHFAELIKHSGAKVLVALSGGFHDHTRNDRLIVESRADYAEFKWALRDYKNYLIDQVGRASGIRVLLYTKVLLERIRQEGYDAVIAACGASQKLPQIPRVEQTPYWTSLEAFEWEAELGRRVVVVGGSETGTETGMYLAEAGHQVTVLSHRHHLAEDGWSIHAYSLMNHRWESNHDFTGLIDAATRENEPGTVTILQNGSVKRLECDDIVLSGGVDSNIEEPLSFGLCASQFFNIGDSRRAENLQYCNRSAL